MLRHEENTGSTLAINSVLTFALAAGKLAAVFPPTRVSGAWNRSKRLTGSSLGKKSACSLCGMSFADHRNRQASDPGGSHMQSHAHHLTEKTTSGVGQCRRADLVRVLLILALLAATGLGISVFADDADLPTHVSGRPTMLEDWHGNVARSTR